MIPQKALLVLEMTRARFAFLGHGLQGGRRARLVGRSPYVRNRGTLRVGSHLVVRGHQFRAAITTGEGGSLVLGDEVLINQGVTLHAAASIVLGDRVKVADLAAIYDTAFHEVEAGEPVRVAPVVLGDDVWIGRGAVILPGVTIGAGSVVAAGSVVVGDVPPACLVAGAPAKVVRQLDIPPGFRRS